MWVHQNSSVCRAVRQHRPLYFRPRAPSHEQFHHVYIQTGVSSNTRARSRRTVQNAPSSMY
ncbi:MAG: hypothetical protein HY962_09725 [Ignavibacteriae bacterium]|nr:hypothetical protein [Ignavibacteriota bacterium]